ncbi:MAG: flavodoxin-dependent (E)-4-hydroxy-3-methylbut-2-enyl-diphosphate synthase [Oscillospiraceae bacterium]|nr:flavodoxin-dependent (E)-4-hydroxy-3-methylbut-2-enyl-diphosphate synthase [Oscillospiraceae bacterium]
MNRRKTKKIMVGTVPVGGFYDISIQSMLKKPTEDIRGNIKQAAQLKKAGCAILRLAIPDLNSVKLIESIKNEVDIPLVADIHFDYKLALEAISAGIDKIRINPGNIGDKSHVREIVNACINKKVPIRVGVNGGSLSKEIYRKYGSPSAEAMCESALEKIKLLNDFDFDNIVVSVKSSDVRTTIYAYEILSQKCNYPLHLGVTEAGAMPQGLVKSVCGIGSLLAHGIGDTIRVTLTDDPLEEISTANNLLSALGIKSNGIDIISCPSCGRTKVNIIELVSKVKEYFKNYNGKNLKLAIMGCAVNGPREAREADLGVAFGRNEGVIFKKGKILKKINSEHILKELIKEVKNYNSI